jgi:hypothetical protein
MSSDSATLVPTQQSVKAYVDAVTTELQAQDLDFQADTGGALSIDLDTETMTFTGGTGITTTGLANDVTFAIDSTVATLTGTQTLTNKTLTSPDVDTPDIDGGTIDGATIATSDITVGTGKTLDVSSGTLTLADNQISGDKVEGGTIASTTITSLASTTVDTTNLEVTNIKAKDGTSAGSIADTTGVVTLASSVLTTTDINGGTIDGATIGGTTAAAGSFTTVSATGNITVDGTVDGRDVATDGTKLDGIEASADVTDTTNVTAAGALMDSELTDITAVKSLDQGVATTDSPTFAGLTTTADMSFGDNDKAIFGAGSDLQIYHDGNHSYVKDAGTGNLNIQTDGVGVVIEHTDGTNLAVFNAGDGTASLYHSGNLKLATTSTGIDVTGTVTADGLTVDGNTTNLNYGKTFFTNGIGTNKWQIWNDNGGTDKFQLVDGDGHLVLQAEQSGDISFFEDTGTTAKFFWDASAESLGIGTSSPSDLMTIQSPASGGGNGITIKRNDNGTDQRVGAISFGNTVDSDLAQITVQTSSGNNGDGNLLFHTQPNGGSTTERMRIDASGNTGIGTTDPSTRLSVRAGSANGIELDQDSDLATDSARLFFNSSSGGYSIFNTSGSLRFNSGATAGSSSGTERMRIDSSGNVGIGTDSPSNPLHVATSSTDVAKFATTGAYTFVTLDNATRNWALSVGSNFDIYDRTAASTRMSIDSSGNLLVGTTSSGVAGSTTNDGVQIQQSGAINAAVNGAPVAYFNRQTSDGDVIVIRQAGSTVGSISVASSTTSYNTSSDQRLKENIVDAPSASDDIDAIQVRSFDWKADGSHQKYGMVAQELQNVAPEAVSVGETEEDMMGVDYSKLVPMLVKEIQSLRARVAQLETN